MATKVADIIDWKIMRDFTEEIFQCMGKHTLLTIDIFSISNYPKTEKTDTNTEDIISFNYSVPEYHSIILPEFLRKRGTIGLKNEEVEALFPIGAEQEEKYNTLNENSLTFIPTPNYPYTKSCDFTDYLDFLKSHKFGKTCLWLNNYNEVQEVRTNVSVLLVFNCNVAKEKETQIKYLSYKKFFTKAVGIITRKLSDILEENSELKSLKILEKQQAERDHFGHTIHNVFPAGLRSLDVLNKKIEGYPELQSLLNNAVKNFTIAKVIFEITSNQQPKELKNQNVIQILQFLQKNSTFRHSIQLSVDVSPLKLTPYRTKDLCNSVFLLLWNFWYNAEKYSGIRQENDKKRDIFINVFNYDGKIAISFKNIGKKFLKYKTRQFLMGNLLKPDKKDFRKGERGGVVVARRKIEFLGWDIIIPDKDRIVREKYVMEGPLGFTKNVQLHWTEITLITDLTAL